MYIAAASALAVLMSWSIYREKQVQEEYDMSSYNPINASLSYSWRQIPQVIVFVEAFNHNTLHSLQVNKEKKSQTSKVMQDMIEGSKMGEDAAK